MFYLVSGVYLPNTASANRIMAYVRTLSKFNVKTRVVFFAPSRTKSTVQEVFPNVEFEYLWQKCYINIPKLNKLSLRLYLKKFVNSLKSGDKIYVYGFPDIVVELA